MKLRAVKGMNDLLPDEVRRWQRLERAFRRTVEVNNTFYRLPNRTAVANWERTVPVA